MADDFLPITTHEGYYGIFSKNEAEGAWPNGTRVRKVNSQDGDGHLDGSLGTILGSYKNTHKTEPKFEDVAYLYWVEWDDMPKVPIGTISTKLEKADD